mgnify:CR=1 FL=1
MTDANTTDRPACASQDGAHPPIALTADAGAQTGRPVILAAEWPGYALRRDLSLAIVPGTATLIVDGAEVTVGLSLDGDVPYGYPTAPHTTDEQDDAIANAVATAWELHEADAQREHLMCGGAVVTL